jgi:hypothetical protein
VLAAAGRATVLAARMFAAMFLRFGTHAGACHNHRECRHHRESRFGPHRPYSFGFLKLFALL